MTPFDWLTIIYFLLGLIIFLIGLAELFDSNNSRHCRQKEVKDV